MSEITESRVSEIYFIAMLVAALFTMVKTRKQHTSPLTDE